MTSWLPPGWRPEVDLEEGGRLVLLARRGLGRPIVDEQAGCGVGQTRLDPLAAILSILPYCYLETCVRAWSRHAESLAGQAEGVWS